MRSPIDLLLSRLARVTSSGLFIPEVDGLRFIAISSVVLLHINTYVSTRSPVSFSQSRLSDALRYACGHGTVGVPLFFAISGFLLSLPFARARLAKKRSPSLKRYYLRRVTRLEPTYIINLLLALVLLVIVKRESVSLLMPHFLASLFYVHNIAYGKMSLINGVAWSLEVEVQFYILAPLLCVVFGVRSAWIRRILMAGVAAVMTVAIPHLRFLPFPGGILLGQLPYFLVGMLLADLYLVSWKSEPARTWAWDLIALPFWIVIPFVSELPGPFRNCLPAAILVAYVGAFRGAISGRVLRNKWLVTIGGMCYTIYLYHYFAISLIGRVAVRYCVTDIYWVNFVLQLVLIGAPLLVGCSVFFILFEKPFMYRDWPARWASAAKRLAAR
jgi:peptidoglycan/LPS O-acetylase OafA/YrhL